MLSTRALTAPCHTMPNTLENMITLVILFTLHIHIHSFSSTVPVRGECGRRSKFVGYYHYTNHLLYQPSIPTQLAVVYVVSSFEPRGGYAGGTVHIPMTKQTSGLVRGWIARQLTSYWDQIWGCIGIHDIKNVFCGREVDVIADFELRINYLGGMGHDSIPTLRLAYLLVY